MSLLKEAIGWGTLIFAFGGWLLYFRENKYRRDVLTDLLQIVYDYDLDRDDLRRSLGYDDVEEKLDRFADE